MKKKSHSAKMNHPPPGLLANYNSLTDKHLAGYFSNTRIRRHLRRSGLISRSGRIISEKEYQLNAMRKDHHKHIRESLAQAIFHKVLDMERHHQFDIKRKFETSTRRDRVQRSKVERSRRAAEDGPRLLSPHPPTGPRHRFGRRRLGDRGHSGQLATYPRPSTAPGSIQHPVRLQPLLSCATDEPAPKAASRPKHLTFEKEQQYTSGGEKGVLKSLDYSAGISPYRLPVVNNFVVPIPSPPKSEKKSGTPRGRRFRPTTAPNGLEQMMKETVKFYRPQIHSNAYVTMIYLGKSVHLSYDLLDHREEIKIYQQHCGGENLCVFRSKLLEGDTFQFISKRHYGFPFSLTFYLNGIQVDRLSTCCEYKHRKGTRLGGKHGYFGLVNVERSAPCYRCIIALGLDKKPSPPKKKTTVDADEKKEDSGKEEYSSKLPWSSSSGEENKYVRFTPATRQRKEFVGDALEMQVEARKRELGRAIDDYEKSPRSAARDAYDEDFEADEEKSDGKVNEEGQAGDQMKRKSKSPSDDEKDNLDHEKENKKSSLKASRASDSERDESDGYTESDLEEEKKQGKGKAADWEMDTVARKIQCFYRKHKSRRQTQGVKRGRKVVRSPSSSSMPYSSDNDSGREMRKRGRKREKTDMRSGYESETAKAQREEGRETDVEEELDLGDYPDKATRDMPHTSHKVREARRRDMSPGSEEGRVVGSAHRSVRDDRDFERSPRAETRSRGPSEDEDEGDGKSVKEKIAEAMEHDRLLSSEPEPSASSTEDEEESIAKKDKYKGDKHKVPYGASLAKASRALESQKVAGQVKQVRQMAGKGRALEEEELADEEGSEEAALGEELRGKKVAALKAKRVGKKELSAELEEEAAVESDLDNVEEEVMYREGEAAEGKAKLKKPKERALGDATSKRKERSQLEGEEVEEDTFIQEASEGDEEAEEAVEGSEVLGTIAFKGKKPAVKKAHRAKEDTRKGTLGKGEDAQAEEETVGDDMESKEGKLLKKGVKDKISVKIQLEDGSFVEAEDVAPGSKLEGILSKDKKKAAVSGVYGGKGVRQGVSSEEEELVQEISGLWGDETKKTSLEVKEKRRISRDKGSAQQKREPQVGEPLSESEAEGVISAAEDDEEEMEGQDASVIRKAERSGVKPRSERGSGRKTSLAVKEKRRISRAEGSEQQQLETGVGEFVSESEAEGNVSAAEDEEEEEMEGEDASVIRKGERSGVRPRSERGSGRKTSLAVKEKRRISRAEGSEKQHLEPEVGEFMSESEAEGIVSAAEDEEEEMEGQDANVIRKAERPGVKPRSERGSGRKTSLAVKEKRRISRAEGSEKQHLEPGVGEFVSESEAEGIMSAAEDDEEEMEGQDASIIQKAERSGVRPRSERGSGRKTSLAVKEKRRISRAEGSEKQHLEPGVGEFMSESEAEGIMSAAEDEEEEMEGQDASVIQKAERPGVKPRSERGSGRKTSLAVKEKRRISRAEGSEQQQLETGVGEFVSESEAEGIMSAAEDEEEEMEGQDASIIRKAERPGVKPRSERGSGRKTSLAVKEKRRISRAEGSEQQQLEPGVGEFVSESEAEGIVSAAEDEEEEMEGQDASIIRKAERSGVRPRSERGSGRKTSLAVKEKRISRAEGSEKQHLEPGVGEFMSESEAEGIVSAAEDEEEEMEGQDASIIRKAERLGVRPRSERGSGRKTSLAVKEKRRISRAEGSEQQQQEPGVGEFMSESEAEGIVSAAEDEEEEMEGQDASIIRKAERSGVRPRSERGSGRKTSLAVKEKRRISRAEGSEQQQQEPGVGEFMSESEAEGIMSAAEDEEEEMEGQDASVIRKAERPGVRPRSERGSGRKTSLAVKEKRRISRAEGSSQQQQEPGVGEFMSESEAEGIVSAAEDEEEEEMEGQDSSIIRKAERSRVKPRSERGARRRSTLKGVLPSAEGAEEEEDLIEEGEEVEDEDVEVEEGGTKEMLRSGVAAPKQKRRLEGGVAKEHDPEAMVLRTGGRRRKSEREGDVEEAKAGRKVAVRRRTMVEDSGEEREGGSAYTVHKKEIAHGRAIPGSPRAAGVAGAAHISEPLSQKAALGEGEKDSKVTFQDTVKKTPKEIVAGKRSPDLGMQAEDAGDVSEKEGEEPDMGEQRITIRDVEEALILGLQQLITQVSQMGEAEEEPEGEVSVEEAQVLSLKQEAGRKEIFAAVAERKTWGAQCGKTEEGGAEEPVEEKHESEQKRTGEEESPAENPPAKETVPSSAQQPQREPPVNFTLEMISLDSFRTSD